MKINYFIAVFLLVVGCLYSCKSTKQHRPNGWYYVIDNPRDSLSKEPVVTIKDFVTLRLDSSINQDGKTIYQIVSCISKHKREKWADATEKSIGKRIGFVYGNLVISAPQVNARIESGNFSISTLGKYDLKKIFYQIRQEKADSIKTLFKYWDEDSLYNALTREKVDSILMDTDYWEISMRKDLADNSLEYYLDSIMDTLAYKKEINGGVEGLRAQELRKMWEEAHRYSASITDTTSLKTRGEMSDRAIDYFTPSGWNIDYAFNQVVYLKALGRARKHLMVEDDQFICELKSGMDIHITEDLYRYIMNLFSNWNTWLKSGKYIISRDAEGSYEIMPKNKQ